MAFHSKLQDWCCKIIADLRFLSIVTNAHSNMISTGITPDIVGHFKSKIIKCRVQKALKNELPNDKNALIEFSCSFTKSMSSLIGIQRWMFFPVEIWWIIFVLSFAFTLRWSYRYSHFFPSLKINRRAQTMIVPTVEHDVIQTQSKWNSRNTITNTSECQCGMWKDLSDEAD